MRVVSLPFEEWPRIKHIVTDVFGNAMPEHPGRAGFVAMMDGDKIVGVLQVESLFHFASLYVDPQYREQRAEVAMALIKGGVDAIPPGYSGIWLSDRKIDNVAELFDGRLVHSEQDDTDRYYVYRKDR